MKHPKFKFGDKLVFKGSPFIVKAIHYAHERFFYGEDGSDGRKMYEEGCVEIYQEPEKKKLYAYLWNKDISGEVMFNVNPELSGSMYEAWTRIPNFDIEFPEAK
jgi:hypothetical protein